MKWLIGFALVFCWAVGWMWITSAEGAEFGVASVTTDVKLLWDNYDTTIDDVAGYKIYRSESSGVYNEANLLGTVGPAVREYVDVGVGDGQWFWTATGVDTAGNESNFAPEVTAILDTLPPPPPPNFRIAPAVILLILD